MNWRDYDVYVATVFAPFLGKFSVENFRFKPPQDETSTSLVSFMSWGCESNPSLSCLGRVANVATRFEKFLLLTLVVFQEDYPQATGGGSESSCRVSCFSAGGDQSGEVSDVQRVDF